MKTDPIRKLEARLEQSRRCPERPSRQNAPDQFGGHAKKHENILTIKTMSDRANRQKICEQETIN